MPERVIDPNDVQVGDRIKDGFGNEGIVYNNPASAGYYRLQYDGYTIINHPDKDWYKLIT